MSKKKIIIPLLFIIAIIIIFIVYKSDKNLMIDLTKMNINEIKKYATENKLNLNIKYEHNKKIDKDKVISQSIPVNKEIKEDDKLDIVISKGKITNQEYQENNIDELGMVPIMMYHGIENLSSTENIGGNVDKDGYNRLASSFKADLEFYYNEGYRIIKLKDYINGKIDVPFGKSPIILTFDDGNLNNFNVTGIDDNGNLIIDPNCAIGILEEFKKKYPDFNVTATFFLMDNLFNQSEYDIKKIKWAIEHGYDIGNHTKDHLNLKNANINQVQNSIGYMYNKLNNIIPGKYVNIIALPYGSPYTKDHENFKFVLNGTYNGVTYKTDATLRVGWDADYSPFNKNFDKTFIKRVRAYDNNGKDFDIQYTFNNLKKTRYISDGDIDTVVIPKEKENLVNTNKEIIKY